jgi:hypothetical protein
MSWLGMKSETNVFTDYVTDISVLEKHWELYNPIAFNPNSERFEFNIQGSAQYIDPRTICLHVEGKVQNADGTAIAAAADIKPGVVNYMIGALWKECSVALNNQEIVRFNHNYHYKALYETLVYASKDERDGVAKLGGFKWDTAGHMNDTDPVGGNNEGLKWRYKYSVPTKTFHVSGFLHVDLFQQNKLLLPFMDCRINLWRNPHSLILTANQAVNNSYKFTITKLQLECAKVTLNPTNALALERTLSTMPAIYNIRRTEVLHYTIPAGTKMYVEDNMLVNVIPEKLSLGLVDTRAFTGSLQHQPFNFEDPNIYSVDVQTSAQHATGEALILNWTKEQNTRAMLHCYMGSGRLLKTLGPEEYTGGYGLISVDLSPDSSPDDDHKHIAQTGKLKISIMFAENTTKNLEMLLFLTYKSRIFIDKNRQVTKDY